MKNVSVLDFGARGDGSLCTKAIQAAIDDCFLSGGGQVEVPGGHYLTGGIRLRSNVVLHLLEDAVLIGTRNPEDYYGYRRDTLEPMDEAEIVDAKWTRAERSENKGRDYTFMRLPGSRWHNSLIRAVNAENIAIIGEKGAMIDGNDCYDEQGEEYYRGPHAIGFFRCKNIRLSGYKST